MGGQGSYRRRKSAVQILFLTLLWLILIPVILALLLAGGVYAYLTFGGFDYDDAGDVDNLLKQEQAAVKDRMVRYDPEAETFTMAFNKQDLWWVIKEAEVENHLLWMVRDELEKLDFQLDAYGFTVEQSEILLSARLVFHQFVPVPVRLTLTPEVNADGLLAFRLHKVEIGQNFLLPLDRLGIENENTADPIYALDIPIHPRMEKLTAAGVDSGRLLLTFSLKGDDLFAEIIASESEAKKTGQLLTNYAARVVFEGKYTKDAPVYAEAIAKMATNPLLMVDYKLDELALASRDAQNAYFEQADAAFQQRFLPGLSADAAYERRNEMERKADDRALALQTLIKTLQENYKKGRLSIGNDRLYFYKAPLELLNMPDLNSADYTGWLSEEQVRVVYLDHYARQAPEQDQPDTEGLDKLFNMPREAGLNMRAMKQGLPCPLGIIVELPDMEHELLYIKTGSIVTRVSISAGQYAELMASANTPHWLPEGTELTEEEAAADDKAA